MPPDVHENVALRDYTTYRIGGPARAFIALERAEDLPEIIEIVRRRQEPYFVLGGGSNILVSDRGFPGTVIYIRTKGLKVSGERLTIQAGESLSDAIEFCIDAGLGGLEWGTSVPGTVGGAVVGNAGAFYGAMDQIVRKVTAFDPSCGVFRTYSNCECGFHYRTSIFKRNGQIISEIEFQLTPMDRTELRRKSETIRQYRASRHPIEPSVGSVFKNIDDKKFIGPFLERHPDAREEYTRRWKSKIPTAYLIDLCGLKGFRLGGVEVAHKHSAFIINIGQAKAEHVAIMVGLIKERIWNAFGIHLREEIRYVGF